ncbi:MAG: cytochrome c biogenesis protein ResB [Thermodesulfovibrionales bacterium]
MLKILLSLRTTIVLLLALILLFLYGSAVMPLKPEFKLLYTEPLLPWMKAFPVGLTWWLWASFGVAALLTANTIVCSIESLVRKREARQWLLIISPQIVHLGFLFILLAHLMSSYGSLKATAIAYQGSMLRLSGDSAVVFQNLRADFDRTGYVRDWSADVAFVKNNVIVRTDTIAPNKPSFIDGLGIYIQTVRPDVMPVAMVEVSKEPGAVWALIGAVFFLVGMTALLVLKIRRET